MGSCSLALFCCGKQGGWGGGRGRWNERERCFLVRLFVHVFLSGDRRAILFRDRDGWKECEEVTFQDNADCRAS